MPNDADALHAIGIALAKENKWREALKKIQEALLLQPNNPPYLNSLGNVYRHLNQWDDAIAAFHRIIDINPNYAVAHNNVGNIYFQQQNLKQAQICYEKAVSLDPHYADAKNNLCNVYYHVGMTLFDDRNFEWAEVYFKQVIAIDYRFCDVNQCMANTVLELGDHDMALHYYFRQLEKNPLFETYYNLGVLLMMKERLNDALQYFNLCLEKNPKDVSAQLNCGNIYLKKNNIVEAAQFYRRADILKPNDAEIQHILLALEQKTIPASAPQTYITHLFDQYAPYYETHLTKQLKYDVPHKILTALENEYGKLTPNAWTIVDLGCGTGLCGSVFKPYAKKLIGVDLSENMLAVAREKNSYDQLLCEDITQALGAFRDVNLILAADVFTYCGDLSLIFAHAKKALALDGLFVFTVEKTFDHDFVLQTSIRYAHSKAYIEKLSQLNGFSIVRLDNIQLRREKNAELEGYLVGLK